MKVTDMFDRLDNVLANYDDGYATAEDVVKTAKEVRRYLFDNVHPHDYLWNDAVNGPMPELLQLVNVVCENDRPGRPPKRFQTLAVYVPPRTIPEEDFMQEDSWGDGDYDEVTDTFYTPSGFYEWQSETETHYRISARVTHWTWLITVPVFK